MRVIVGGRTCSAVASSVSVRGPPKTSTDSADSCAGGTPVAGSSRRTCRKAWIAAEWKLSAASIDSARWI